MNIQIKSKIMDEQDLGRTIARLTHEILEKNKGLENIWGNVKHRQFGKAQQND